MMIELIEEIRHGAMAETLSKTDATLADCKAAILRMNGTDRSLVSMRQGELTVLVGGGVGQYIVTAEDHISIRNLLQQRPEQDEADTIDVTVGGQAVDYPAYYVVNVEMVWAAILECLAVNEASERKELEWEQMRK